MSRLVYDEKQYEQGKLLEKAGLDNHLCDATKYAWDWLNTYVKEEKPKVFDKYSKEWEDNQVQLLRQRQEYSEW